MQKIIKNTTKEMSKRKTKESEEENMQKLKSIKRENSKNEVKLKGHSGITLIALIITIIVLLILAGVALATLTGDSGILSNAEKAKQETLLANSKEQVQLAIQGALTEGLGTITKANLVAELDKLLGDGEENYTITGEEAGPWTVTATKTGYSTTISSTGKMTEQAGGGSGEGDGDGTGDTATLPIGEGTTPWLPAGFSQVAETNLSNGLTITNTTDGSIGNQNYVWIEVPTTITASVTRDGTATTVALADAQNDSEIYTILEAYAGKGTESDYTKGSSSQSYSSWKEEWYDKYNATWDGTSTYAYIAYKSSSNFSEWKDYYGENNVYTSTASDVTGTMTPVDFSTATYNSSLYYFAKVDDNFKNHDDGCGLAYQGYQTAYNKMLNSIKENGGFWLAQYEAGIAYEAEDAETATNRTSHTAIGDNPSPANYAKDQYPYNYVYCSEAQKIANADSTNEYTSSLPFGIQWDLVCKFLEVKTGLDYPDIATQSTWGNYKDTTYTPSETAKYSTDYGASFDPVVAEDGTVYEKTASGYVLLTTGAIEEATATVNSEAVTKDSNPMNIYDFAGNVYEWTLERATAYTNNPCASRGGNYYNSSSIPASFRNYNDTSYANYSYGFRGVLY